MELTSREFEFFSELSYTKRDNYTMENFNIHKNNEDNKKKQNEEEKEETRDINISNSSISYDEYKEDINKKSAKAPRSTKFSKIVFLF